jgi:hypothetical protein
MGLTVEIKKIALSAIIGHTKQTLIQAFINILRRNHNG